MNEGQETRCRTEKSGGTREKVSFQTPKRRGVRGTG